MHDSLSPATAAANSHDNLNKERDNSTQTLSCE